MSELAFSKKIKKENTIYVRMRYKNKLSKIRFLWNHIFLLLKISLGRCHLFYECKCHKNISKHTKPFLRLSYCCRIYNESE